ncbi:Gfo/Idh/MocA family oxidoreductase [Pseudonocardia zijingensis]|uniref:Gfo/Idh/MocA family oxidoreductase n=1 Tax=Pseudonocardia zijingensis TaxID=153376 RepID=A0ABP4A8S1_9PSEU
MTRQRIGVMSMAHLHALGYIGLLNERADVELVVTDPDAGERPPGESGGRELAERLGVRHYVDSYEELLDRSPDGVVICSENSRHRALTELAAAAGAHVLCEKPMATTVADGEAMVAACAAAGVHLMVAYPVRFSRQFRALRAAAANLGRVVAVTGTNNGKMPSARAWFADPVLAGGGAVMDHTVHLADLLDVLLDGAEAESVHAVANRIVHETAAVETGGLVSLRYPGGVVATFDCSWSVPESYPTWGGLTMRLTGDGGIADMDAFGQAVHGFRESTRAPLRVEYGTGGDAAMLEEFLSAIRDGRLPQPDGESGLRSLRVVERAYESVRTGEPA